MAVAHTIAGMAKIARSAAAELSVAEVMLSRPKTLPHDSSVADLRRLFSNPHVRTALLVDGERYVGTVERSTVTASIGDDEPASSFVGPAPTIGVDEPITTAYQLLDSNADGRVVVLDRDGIALRGLLCLDSSRSSFCSGG